MRWLNGWPIVGWATLVVGAMVGVILALAGTGEAGLRMVIRATARTSLVLFSLAFAASALCQVWPGRLSRWLLTNRRYLGVSFAASHTIHLLAILSFAGWTWHGLVTSSNTVTLVAGGIAYVFITAMTATSFDRTAAWLGPRRWQRLHTTGAYYIWAIFALNFGVLAFRATVYVPFALLVVVSMILRLVAPLLAPRSGGGQRRGLGACV